MRAPRRKRRGGDPVPIGKLIREVLLKRGIQGRLPMQNISEAYQRVVEERLSKRTRVAGLRAGVVTVDVDSASLAYELQGFLGAEILARLQAEPGVEFVKRIRFVVGAR